MVELVYTYVLGAYLFTELRVRVPLVPLNLICGGNIMNKSDLSNMLSFASIHNMLKSSISEVLKAYDEDLKDIKESLDADDYNAIYSALEF